VQLSPLTVLIAISSVPSRFILGALAAIPVWDRQAIFREVVRWRRSRSWCLGPRWLCPTSRQGCPGVLTVEARPCAGDLSEGRYGAVLCPVVARREVIYTGG
jgi:hypothetical protein